MRALTRLLLGVVLLSGFTQVWAGDAEMERMQRQLNKETMDKPFFAEEPEKVDAYIKEASKNRIKPLEYTGKHWPAVPAPMPPATRKISVMVPSAPASALSTVKLC